jgi:hypothetical protein
MSCPFGASDQQAPSQVAGVMIKARPRLTPAHASWLNQAELLNDVFGYHYLKRRSWRSRQELIDHIQAACPEYNQLYAHPFQWKQKNALILEL